MKHFIVGLLLACMNCDTKIHLSVMVKHQEGKNYYFIMNLHLPSLILLIRLVVTCCNNTVSRYHHFETFSLSFTKIRKLNESNQRIKNKMYIHTRASNKIKGFNSALLLSFHILLFAIVLFYCCFDFVKICMA